MDNGLIVNGVDLAIQFGLILIDGYTLTPPSPKTHLVDIPGGNGKLDLTESLLGDTAYDNRKQEFTFYVINPSSFEQVKTNISNFLHGKAYDYTMTMDPGYTYHGRFSVSSYEHSVYSIGIIGHIKIEIDAKPFKHKQTMVYTCSAIGGNIYYFQSGRERVRPVLESSGYLKVIFKGKQVILGQGTWVINDLMFKHGENELYLNSYEIHNFTWGDLIDNNITWGAFKRRKLYEWYKSDGDTNLVVTHWEDVTGTWADLAANNTTWADLAYHYEDTGDIADIYVKYDWGDL